MAEPLIRLKQGDYLIGECSRSPLPVIQYYEWNAIMDLVEQSAKRIEELTKEVQDLRKNNTVEAII